MRGLRDANWLTKSFLEGPEGPEGPKDADDACSCQLLPALPSCFLRRSFPVVHRRSPPGRRARSKLCRSSRSRAHLPSSSAPLCYDSAGFVIGSAVVLHFSQPGIHGPSAVGNQQCEWPAHACPRLSTPAQVCKRLVHAWPGWDLAWISRRSPPCFPVLGPFL